MRIFIVSIIASLLIILGSCDHRELCYDHEHWIDLEDGFDWADAPNGNPVTMVVWFFPEDPDAEGGPRSYEFGGKNGGSIRIPAGNYRAICFNGGTETLLERGSSFEDFHITTDTQDILGPMNRSMDVTPRPKPGKDEDVKQAPETLWSAQLTEIKLLGGVANQKVTFKPTESTRKVHIRITGVENYSADISVSAAMTSLSEAWSISGQTGCNKNVTMPISISATAEGVLEGEINIFGHCHAEELTHILTIYSSNKYYWNFDVTDNMHEVGPTGLIEININGLKIPDPEGTGMTPSVPGWEEGEDIHIDML